MTNPLTKAFRDLESLDPPRRFQWTGEDAAFVGRVDAALTGLTIPADDLAEWRECCRRWGPRSRSALGCLLGFVRWAWNIWGLGPRESFVNGHVCFVIGQADDVFGVGIDEPTALLAALEAAPR